jgi:site-specific recombinase XerD
MASISRLLRQLMTAAGIPKHYVAYSIRHALITALFEAGLDEKEVNAYNTGHSHTAHTAQTVSPQF